jgi:hypothetical protein
MTPVKSRIVMHFPGFEPLDANQHRARFARAAAQACKIWNISIASDELQTVECNVAFNVQACGPNWTTSTQYHVFDLASHIHFLLKRPFLTVLSSGFGAFAKVVAFGGTWNYLRHAWRFGLFSIFPFLFMALGLALTAVIALLPLITSVSMWNFSWTMPLALGLFGFGFLPIANRLHTMLLFSDWKCAVDFATLKDERLNSRIADMVESARAALNHTADEYLIVSHSIGGNAAVHVIGQLLENEPELFIGKNIVFASVGSGILQGALLAPAKILRSRVNLIVANPNIFWFDVQCLTDVSNFYFTNIAKLCGYNGAQQPSVSFVRIKTMLKHERYQRIKRDLLRVHRQYVLGNDVRANYDFALMCAGPLRAAGFAALKVGEFAPIGEDGSIRSN